MNKQEIKKALEMVNGKLDGMPLACVETRTKYETIRDLLQQQLTNGWIPFASEYDEDSKMEMLQGKIPEEDEEILVTNGESVWSDTFMRDGTECYLDSGCDLIDTVVAWQPLPQPYKEDNANG